MSRYVDLDKLTWKAVMVRDVAVPIYLKDEVDRAAVQDVAPVVHARWIKVNPFVDTEECSNCRYNILSVDFETNYCPDCGAKMDEVEE